MHSFNMNSISVMSLQNIYDSGDDSEISELRKQNNKRLEELLQQGRQEMSRRMKNESDAGTLTNINNSTAEKPDQEQIIKEPNKLETVTEGFTDIQDAYADLVKTNKFDWKQNDTKSQKEECKLQVLPKKSEKFKECLLKNSELFEGTRIPKNKYRKKRQHSDKIVDLPLNFQEKHNNTTTKLSTEPLFLAPLLPVTNVWLQKRGADLFSESHQTCVNVISCTSPTEEKMLEMALAASLVTAAKEGVMVPVDAEQVYQIQKPVSTASTFIPPISTENENWDSDSTGSELALQEFDKDDSYHIEENKTAKSYKNVQEIVKNNSRNKCNDIYNDEVTSLKNTCNTYEMRQSRENIEHVGVVSKKVTIDRKYVGVGITENSEASCNRKTIATQGKLQNCDNDNWRTNFSSECINKNRLQSSYNKVIQKSKTDIKLFEKDKMSTVSNNHRLNVQVPGDTLMVKNSRSEDKILINHKPLHEIERVATMKINFSYTSKQGVNFEIKNNEDSLKDKPSQEPVFKLNNPEIKKINHKTCYFQRSQNTESKLSSSTLPHKQDKPNGFETGSSKSTNEGVSNICDKSGTDCVNCVNTSANCPVQLNEDNILVDTGSTQETYLKRNYQERSTSDKLVEPPMQEIAIEQLLRYETVATDFVHTVPHHSSKEKINQCYTQLPTAYPYMKQAIGTGWVPYLNPGMSQQPAMIQAPIPSASVLMRPQLAFLNPSQHPWQNNYVTQPPGVVHQSDCVVELNLEQTRNITEPRLVPPLNSGTLCGPYFPVPAPQVINSQQTTSKISHFDYQQHRKFVPMVQLEGGTNNSTKNLATENLSAQDYGLPPRPYSINPHLSQRSLQEVSYMQPVPPKAELYYQNLQNMMQVDMETLNQQIKNLLQLQLQPGNNGLTQISSYGCTTDFGRQTERQNSSQLMTTDQQIMTQYGRLQSSHVVTTGSDFSPNSHQSPPLMCGNSSALTWQQAAVPFTQLSGRNHSFAALPPTSESTNVRGKGVTPITSLSLAAKGRGRCRNPDI